MDWHIPLIRGVSWSKRTLTGTRTSRNRQEVKVWLRGFQVILPNYHSAIWWHDRGNYLPASTKQTHHGSSERGRSAYGRYRVGFRPIVVFVWSPALVQQEGYANGVGKELQNVQKNRCWRDVRRTYSGVGAKEKNSIEWGHKKFVFLREPNEFFDNFIGNLKGIYLEQESSPLFVPYFLYKIDEKLTFLSSFPSIFYLRML